MHFSSCSVEHVWAALTEEVQVDPSSLVKILAPFLIKSEAIPCCGVIAVFVDILTRAEVDIVVVLGVVAPSVGLSVVVPVGLFDQIPKPVDGLDLVITEAVEPHGIKLGVEA